MKVDIQQADTENFKDLPNFRLFPYSCKYCAFWEDEDFSEKTRRDCAEETKRRWFLDMMARFGSCGLIAYVDGEPIGFAQYAPTEYFPSVTKYDDVIPSRDAVFLACLYIADRQLRKKGIGTRMFEKLSSDLRIRGCGAIEAFARTSCTPSDNVPD